MQSSTLMSYTLVLRSKDAVAGDANSFVVEVPTSVIPTRNGEPFWVQMTGFQATLSSVGALAVHCSFSRPGITMYDTHSKGTSDCVGVVASSGGNYVPGPRILCRSPGPLNRIEITLRSVVDGAPMTTSSATTVILSVMRADDKDVKF